MIRLLDIIFSFLSLILFFPLFILIFLVGFLDTGFPLFIQKRVGLNLKNFKLIKFRTMKIDTLSAGTHLIDPSNITCFGNFLRKSKLDEVPQLLNVLIGHMSLVGPRPCLPSQKRLIIMRKKREIYKVKPGITGLAQVSGINMSRPVLLAKTDLKMIKQMNLFYYFYYIFKTFLLIFRKSS
jgi:lipopolysaccharide/colanic/teichoic acid biosynthesis glycosyltransferase